MKPQNRVWLAVFVFFLTVAIIACSCNDVIRLLESTATPTLHPQLTQTVATPNLEGSWEDLDTGVVHTIAWDGEKFVVVSSIHPANGEYPITDQGWDGSVLTWTYYDEETGTAITYETISATFLELYANWWTNSGSGTETLIRRVEGPPAVE